jgi:cysteine synthase A
MAAFGAHLTLVPSINGKAAGPITPDLTPRMIEVAQEIANKPGTYFTNQLHNPDVVKGYEPLGRELLAQVKGPIHAFCGGVGTAGMLMGVARVLRQAGNTTKIVALEPAASAVISRGKTGAHDVDGIGIGFIPPLLDKNYYDEARGIDEEAAREVACRLAREEGIFTGTSSGLNVAAAQQLARELGPGHTVVTVAVDTGLKYLAGNLFT